MRRGGGGGGGGGRIEFTSQGELIAVDGVFAPLASDDPARKWVGIGFK